MSAQFDNSRELEQLSSKSSMSSYKGFTKVMSKAKTRDDRSKKGEKERYMMQGKSFPSPSSLSVKSAPLKDLTNQKPIAVQTPALKIETAPACEPTRPAPENKHGQNHSRSVAPSSFTSVTDILDQSLSTGSDDLELADANAFPSIAWMARFDMKVYKWVVDDRGRPVSYAVMLRQDIGDLLRARENRRLKEIEAASGCPMEIQEEVVGAKLEPFLVLCGVESQYAKVEKPRYGDWRDDGSSSDGSGFFGYDSDGNDNGCERGGGGGSASATENSDPATCARAAPLAEGCCVTQALQAVSAFAHKVLAAKGLLAPPPPSKTYIQLPNGSLEIRVIDSAVGFILGVNGAKIKDLTRKTGTDIQITKRLKRASIFTITGKGKVAAAEKMIQWLDSIGHV